MREIRKSGSEGGVAQINALFLPLSRSAAHWAEIAMAAKGQLLLFDSSLRTPEVCPVRRSASGKQLSPFGVQPSGGSAPEQAKD